MEDAVNTAQGFLKGAELSWEEADTLWKRLKKDDELSLARSVLAQIRRAKGLLDRPGVQRAAKQELCRQEALLTSIAHRTLSP